MLTSELNPAYGEQIRFSYPAISTLPESPGCYAIATYGKEILYIGKSEKIYSRAKQHWDEGEKRKPTPKGSAFWLAYKLCGRHEISALERGWILQYTLNSKGKLPYFNKSFPPA